MKPIPMRNFKMTLGVAAISLLAGCSSLHTPYQQQALSMPAAWQNQPIPTAGAATQRDRWWRNFNDPQLDQLIELALARNNDLAAAAILVRRAQLQAGLAATNPTVSLGLSTSNSRNLGGSSNNPPGLSGAPASSRSQSLSASVAYEVDLWGKLASQRDAAQWEALATAEDRDSAALSLIGTTAGLYWKIANLQQRIALSEQSIAYVARILQLVRVQYDAGAVSSLEVLEAERSLASQQAGHTQLLQDMVETRSALAILFDGPPETEGSEHYRLAAETLPAVDAGLPAELLARRPDLRAAELRLRKTLSSADAMRASYYPTFSLTGSLGSASTSLQNLLQNPVGTLASSLTFPFLQWNQMQLNIAVSKIDYEKASVDFRQTFYKALRDVEIALSARSQFQAQGLKLAQSLAAARRVESLYQERYRAGSVALKIWLDAQETLRSAEIAMADNNLNLLNSQVKLYQALGGDMKIAAASPAAAERPPLPYNEK
ncbi:efflux transporter outer membrane subunit [Collimonas humicola]|uniref:efflux transporter outer membrane subunit n=1 Tax=Collimonas humicola TaxID=2825886 RepID=UPI001E5653DE|nr:efflux transporter outer membrane subunit [Collimonas humicola]